MLSVPDLVSATIEARGSAYVDGVTEFKADFESECQKRRIGLFELAPKSPAHDARGGKTPAEYLDHMPAPKTPSSHLS